MTKVLTGSGHAGGGGDKDEFLGDDAKAVAEELKKLGGTRSAVVESRAEILDAVERGELNRVDAEGKLRDLLAVEDRNRRGHLFAAEHTEEYVKAAKVQIERRILEEAPRVQDPEATLAKYALWLRCKRAQLHQGIFLLKDPRTGPVGKKDWVAFYKPKTDESKDAFWRGEILCQECLRAGRKERLPYEWIDYEGEVFVPNMRHVWKTPKDFATYELEGHSRLTELPNEAANLELRRLNHQIDLREGHLKAKEAARG